MNILYALESLDWFSVYVEAICDFTLEFSICFILYLKVHYLITNNKYFRIF